MKTPGYTFPKRLFAGCGVALCLLVPALFVITLRAGAGSERPRPSKDEATGAGATAVSADALARGRWEELSPGNQIFPTRNVPIHISVLPNGKLLYWGRDKADLTSNNTPLPPPTPTPGSTPGPTPPPDGIPDWDEQGKSNTYVWDPLYPDEADISPSFLNTYMKKQNTTTNLFCSGHSFLQDGTLLAAGGHRRHFDQYKPQAEGVGDDALNLFDYRTGQWSLLRDSSGNQVRMPHGRWYPTSLTLSNGETVIMSGSYLDGTNVNTARYWLNTTPDIVGLNGSLRQSAYDDPVPGTSNIDGYVTATYPRIFLAPDGRVFYTLSSSFPDTYTRFLDTLSTPNAWSPTDDTTPEHYDGSGVMYAPGKVMVMGGRTSQFPGEPVSTADLYDTVGNPNWAGAASMAFKRNRMTGTLLPDGKVLAVGGTRCAGTNEVAYNIQGEDPATPPCAGGQVLTPELWTPPDAVHPAGAWAQMAPHKETRVYHSTSLLLPDGRVLVGGGGLPLAGGETAPDNTFCYGDPSTRPFSCRNSGHNTFEIFSPPYLFEQDASGGAVVEARRPVIVSAPDSIAYGQQFTVEVGDVNPASDIAQVVLLRLPSVTHGFDQDERRVTLASQPNAAGTGLTVTAPADGKACPPGPYMMFIIRNNGRGTPSVSKIIRAGSFSVDSSSASFNFEPVTPDPDKPAPLTGQIAVSAPAGQGWTATVNANASSWVTITSGASGTGGGLVTYTVASNTGARRRDGTISIKPAGRRFGGFEFTVYQAARFADVTYPPDPNSQAYNISRISARGVTIGCGDGSVYCPAEYVTRRRMALFLARTLGFKSVPANPSSPDVNSDPSNPTPVPNSSVFADISSTDQDLPAIDFIRRKGVTTGCAVSPLRYCPDNVVSRAEMAVFIIRAMGMVSASKPTAPATPTFVDVPTTHWAYPFVEEMVRRGITSGCGIDPDGNRHFCPASGVDRQQMATFLARAFKF